MKQLYELSSNINSRDELLSEYKKLVKTGDILKDLCNIMFINPRPYVYYTLKKYLSGAVKLCTSEFVVEHTWYFIKTTPELQDKIQSTRESRVREILHIRYKRNLDPVELAEYEESVQRIIDSFKNNKANTQKIF